MNITHQEIKGIVKKIKVISYERKNVDVISESEVRTIVDKAYIYLAQYTPKTGVINKIFQDRWADEVAKRKISFDEALANVIMHYALIRAIIHSRIGRFTREDDIIPDTKRFIYQEHIFDEYQFKVHYN